MKTIELDSRNIYNIEINETNKEFRSVCPICSSSRKKKNEKVVAWNTKDKVGYCHHCGSRFVEYKSYDNEKKYYIPKPDNRTELTDKAKNWLVEKRLLTQDVVNKMKLYSKKEFIPQVNKEMSCICFPYYRDGKLVNIKYRDGQKNFKFVKGAELILYNHDTIYDNEEIIITEGEMDALTYMVCGFNNVVSVPNGAKNYSFFDNYSELLKDKKLIISTDNDLAGQDLKNEIIRRYGADACNTVNLKDTKDANSFFKKYTYDLKEVIEKAEPVPVKGMVKVRSFKGNIRKLYEEGKKEGLKIDQPSDEFITFESGRLMIVTGIPGHGKSFYINNIVARLNLLHNWKVAYFTPENYPLEYHYKQLFEVLIGKKFSKSKCEDIEYDMAFEHINDNFFYVLNEDDTTPESVIEVAKSYVRRKGIKIFVIDPYNKLEHQSKSNESETRYISRFLDMLSNFARFKDVLVILVAHPRKIDKVKGQIHNIPTLYDIAGSAHFYNQADYGLTVYRKKDEKGFMNEGEVHYQKIRFANLGKTGKIQFRFNYNNGRFEDGDADVNHWDNSNWLTKEKECPF